MNLGLLLMVGALVLLALSGLLVFCFTEAKGKNTPHARRDEAIEQTEEQDAEQQKVVSN